MRFFRQSGQSYLSSTWSSLACKNEGPTDFSRYVFPALRVARSAKSWKLFWLVPGKFLRHPVPALPAGKTRRKKYPAKSCLPRSVQFHEAGSPASAQPILHRSRHAAPVLHAKFLWLREPRRVMYSGQTITRQPSRSRTQKSRIKRYTSHKWDCTNFPAQEFTHTSLYLIPDAFWPGKLKVENRLYSPIGQCSGGNCGNKI